MGPTPMCRGSRPDWHMSRNLASSDIIKSHGTTYIVACMYVCLAYSILALAGMREALTSCQSYELTHANRMQRSFLVSLCRFSNDVSRSIYHSPALTLALSYLCIYLVLSHSVAVLLSGALLFFSTPITQTKL